jgi:hypothetical protein
MIDFQKWRLGKCLVQMDDEDRECWFNAYIPWRGTILVCHRHLKLLVKTYGTRTGHWRSRKTALAAIIAREEMADVNKIMYAKGPRL